MILDWDDSLSSGIEEVDFQHKEFIKLIQRLQILHEKGAPRDFTLRILQELSKYAEYHFISEENLMIVTRYPAIEAHQVVHKKLLRTLSFRIDAYADGSESLGALVTFLAGWLASHTRDEDSKIGQYLRTTASPGGTKRSNTI